MILSLSEKAYYESLHIAFLVLCVQELAWLITPPAYFGNLLYHAIRLQSTERLRILAWIGLTFSCISGFLIAFGLLLAHKIALHRHRPYLFWPYILSKSIRAAADITGAIYLWTSGGTDDLLIIIYCCIEAAVGLIAIEMTLRAWLFVKKIRRREQEHRDVMHDDSWQESSSTLTTCAKQTA